MSSKAFRRFPLIWFRSSEMSLNGNKGALEENVINDVTLAAFSANDPIPAFYVDKTKIGGDRLRLSTLHSVHDHWSRTAINAHNDFRPTLWPTLIYLIVSFIKYVEGKCKGFIGFFDGMGLASERVTFIVPSAKRAEIAK
jgi:hypothetical protein